jgi:hypothetical protein
MNEKGNQYAIAALKDRRATLAGEIVKFKQDIRDRHEQLSHLDPPPLKWSDLNLWTGRALQEELDEQSMRSALIYSASR